MNQKFKSGKKVLSLVLSVLMLKSCLVFAPVANAAETLPKSDVVITIKVTNELVLESNNGTFTMTLMFSDGTSKVKEVIDKINELIADGYKEDGSDYGITDQKTVDDATKALNDYLNSLDKDGDGKVDEDNLKHYAIRFLSDGKQVGETQSLVKGAAVTVPANPTKAAEEHKTYQFKGWSPEVTEVKGDQDYTAVFTFIDYTEYDKVELFLEELNKKIDDNDPDVIKYYTVKFIWHDGSSEKKYVKGATVAVPTVESYVYGGFTYEFTGWDKAVVAVDGDAEYKAQYTEPRSMDDVIEAEKKADDIIGNKDYYEEDRKAVEDAKKELDEYLDEKGVEIDENGNVTNNPVAKDSEEDAKITELVQKLNDAINTANKNKEERDKAFNKTSGFLGWLTRLLILVRHLLNMV